MPFQISTMAKQAQQDHSNDIRYEYSHLHFKQLWVNKAKWRGNYEC